MNNKTIEIHVNEFWEKYLAASNIRELIDLLNWCDELSSELLDKGMDDETFREFLNSIPNMIITAKIRNGMHRRFCEKLEDQNLIFKVTSKHISTMPQEEISTLLYYDKRKELSSDPEFKKKMML
ncbi:hypothetical protein L2D08_19770 [Domibacillus sp. PGB-M46]|uniref:hypothetical protein n=1 Tax=Domibacillus sp. PGB-M46 TaxID=2910255 RepID=UPI001F587C91|nr:hypothetical protein [Domibacillus sp. PGB-M46]MCI2256578.1 hypothetical protein [Domibacillus sp. PGB-M46]